MRLIMWLLAFIVAPWLFVAGFVVGLIWLELNHPGIAATLLMALLVTLLVKFFHWGVTRGRVQHR